MVQLCGWTDRIPPSAIQHATTPNALRILLEPRTQSLLATTKNFWSICVTNCAFRLEDTDLFLWLVQSYWTDANLPLNQSKKVLLIFGSGNAALEQGVHTELFTGNKKVLPPLL